MKPIFRATALLSGSTAINVFFNLISAKVLASILGPTGYGYYGLLQSFISVVALMAGVGMATGIVRQGASAAKNNDIETVAKVRKGAGLVVFLMGILLMAFLTIFRAQVSQWVLADRQHQGTILLMGIATWFMITVNVQTGILNAWHKVEALAAYGIVNSIIPSAINIICVLIWRDKGIVPAVLMGCVAASAAARWFLWRNVKSAHVHVSLKDTYKAARSLLAFGIPFMASTVLGNGVQLALPIVVLHLLNTEAVAYYKAAAAISVGYLGFLVTAMGQDYYPRLSAVRSHPQKLVALIHDQYRLVLLLAGPMILITLALVPYIVPLVYSKQFTPSAKILEWQLIGDLFKFTGWTMSFAILAHSNPKHYFCGEVSQGVLTLVTTWIGVKFFGLAGLGVGFVLTYIVYYFVVRTIVRRELPVTETFDNLKLMVITLVTALIIRILPSTPLASYRTLIAISLAVILGAWNFRIIWREYISGKMNNKITQTEAAV